MRMTVRGLSIVCFILAMGLTNARAQQAAPVVALKSGETADVGNAFWIVNCRSLLKGHITVEILEGPPNVTVSIREQKVVPRAQNCANPVDGGILLVTAPKEIKERTQSKLVLRLRIPTVDGERQGSREYNLILLP